MALELRQQVKLTQQLVMTPQLQQAIKLLQLSRLELAETIQQEMEHNPVLEEAPEEEGGGAAEEPEVRPDPETTPAVSMEDGGGETSMREIDWTDYANEYESLPSIRPGDDSEFPSRLNILTRKPDLASHLQWQLSLSDLSDEEKEVGEFIIGNLDKDGFLDIDTPEIAAATGCDEETAARLVRVVQEMDPAGIGARNVQESLLLQLERLGLGDSLAAVIVRDHLRLLERKNYAGIVRATKASRREVLAAIDVITGLDPHPGRLHHLLGVVVVLGVVQVRRRVGHQEDQAHRLLQAPLRQMDGFVKRLVQAFGVITAPTGLNGLQLLHEGRHIGREVQRAADEQIPPIAVNGHAEAHVGLGG